MYPRPCGTDIESSRVIATNDIESAWAPLDDALHRSLRLVRDNAAELRRGDFDAALFQLPLRLDGLGVPRHALIGPHARTAMELMS